MIRFIWIALCLNCPLVARSETPLRIVPGKQTGLIPFRSKGALDTAGSGFRVESLRWLICVLGALSLLLRATAVEAASKPRNFRANTLELIYIADGVTPTSALDALWDSLCKTFSQQFIVGKGPQGRGLFKEVSCRHLQTEFDFSTASKSDWRMAFISANSELSIQAFYLNKSIFLWELPKELSPAIVFSNPVALQYLVAQVYRRLPAAWRLTAPELTQPWRVPSFDENQMPGELPVEKVIFYQLEFDQDRVLWLPKPKAMARLDREVAFENDASESTLLIERLHAKDKLSIKGTLWAQEIYSEESKGKGKGSNKSLLSVLGKISPDDSSRGFNSTRGSTTITSLRYLRPLARSESALTRTPRLELEMKIQKGWLEGLVLGFEKSISPAVTEDNPYIFDWQRESLGWAFRLGLDTQNELISSQFRITPRISLLTVNANFPAEKDVGIGTIALQYQATNQLDLGAEISWELKIKSYSFWLLGSNHLSGKVLKKSGEAEVSNLHLGALTHYRSPYHPFGLSLGLEALASVDWIDLDKGTAGQFEQKLFLKDDELDSGVVALTVFYLGLGVTFSW